MRFNLAYRISTSLILLALVAHSWGTRSMLRHWDINTSVLGLSLLRASFLIAALGGLMLLITFTLDLYDSIRQGTARRS